MLNRYEHDDADTLRNSVEEVLPVIQALIARAREQDAPIVYNYDDWSAGPAELCEQALPGAHGALVEPILPPPGAAPAKSPSSASSTPP
jgi:nicotinamidase-related amidase